MDPYEKLCTKDPRYPMFNNIHGDEDEKPTPRQGCACDNCFYGRDAMALEIIRLCDALEKNRSQDCRECTCDQIARIALNQ